MSSHLTDKPDRVAHTWVTVKKKLPEKKKVAGALVEELLIA